MRCSPMFIFVPVNPGVGVHHFGGFAHVNTRPPLESAVNVAVVLLTTMLVVVFALLAAPSAGKLARMDGATYRLPSAVPLSLSPWSSLSQLRWPALLLLSSPDGHATTRTRKVLCRRDRHDACAGAETAARCCWRVQVRAARTTGAFTPSLRQGHASVHGLRRA